MTAPDLAFFARPIRMTPGAAAPDRFRITLAGMRTEPWLLFGAWAAGGAVLAMLGFWQVGLATSAVGALTDLAFQRRLKALWDDPDLDGEAGIRKLTPIVATRFGLGVAGSLIVMATGHSAETMAVVMMLQAWSICVAMAQFSAVPRLFLTAIAPPLIAVTAALWPYFDGPAGPALGGSLLLLVAILAVIARQVGQVWQAWSLAWADNTALIGELRAARAAADQASQAKSTFLATMSHEVRTPLNGILGMAQVMALNPLDADQRERVDIIRRSGETLLGTLNAVLDLSRIEAGRLDLMDGVVQTGQLVGDSVSAFAASAALKGLTLEATVHPDAAGPCRGDPVRLRQIIDNLVGNAVKFTASGGVGVSVTRRGEALVIEVADTGRGIRAEDLERIFRPFEQADAGHRRHNEGSGLGLSISMELARLMGGAIEAESVEGQGTRFRLSVPAPVVEPTATAPQAAPPATEAPTPAAFSVLVAEDNPTNQTVIRSLLQHLGAEVEMVGDGRQAVDRLAERAFDVVLMDVQMPVMDGLDATRTIRDGGAGDAARAAVIIGVTGNAMDHQVAECLDAGMTAVVAKPIQLAALVATLNAALAEPDVDAGSAPEAHVLVVG
jgi:two-component system, sensor histidine kinase